MRNTLRQGKGITLIALIITIIVLLILAGVSINIISGNNSLLQKAAEAKAINEKAGVIENARLEIMGEQVNTPDKKITPSIVKSILSKYFDTDSVNDINEDQLTDQTYLNDTKVRTSDGKHEIALAEILNGVPIKAGSNLKTKLATHPESSDPAIKSPYVMYNGILCRVLHNNENGVNGVEIISNDVMKQETP